MNGYPITLAGQPVFARGSGALYWPAQSLLVISDLHLGKANRRARGGAALLPPYETKDTLHRLGADLAETRATGVLCLGDSFDDRAAAEALSPEDRACLEALQSGRRWIWILGNHDPEAGAPGGSAMAELRLGGLTFRHIASKVEIASGEAEVSGHYHPKASLSLKGTGLSRPCFLTDGSRLVMPAFGTYTGGLSWRSPVFGSLMRPDSVAILTGPRPMALPMPRQAAALPGSLA